MEFIKYPSITNHYQTKTIERFLGEIPELEYEEYIIEEKIHGTNIQLIFTPTEHYKICTRNHILDDDENHYNIRGFLETYSIMQMVIDAFNKISRDNMVQLNVYFEYFGKGIMKEVYYGDCKYICVLGMAENGIHLSPADTIGFLDSIGFTSLKAPTLDVIKGLQNALDFNIIRDTFYATPEEGKNTLIEGIVIKPYRKVYINNSGSTFMLKKKNDLYIEKKHKEKKEVEPLPENIQKLKDEFDSLITEARVCNIFSKYGAIEETRDIGKYISLVMNDAIEEFKQEYEDEIFALSKQEKKSVFNVGNQIAKILKDELFKGDK